MEENGRGLNRTKWQYIAFSAITLWALAAGFFLIYSYFPSYDDEGYLMITVKQTLDGGILYDEVYTQYGPVYYIYRWILSGVFMLPITHDATRLSTLVVWILTALGSGVIALRYTSSIIAGSLAYVLTFCFLSRVVSEPGHPQDIAGLLVVAAIILLTGKEQRTLQIRLGAVGILLALLVLTKVNLGLFFGIAVTIALLGFSRFRGRRALQIALILIAAVLPFILFRDYLQFGWLRMSMVVAAGVISAGIISRTTDDVENAITAGGLVLMATCFVTTIAVVILIMLASGSSMSAMLDGVILQHLKFGGDFYQPAPIQRYAAYCAVIGLTVAVVYSWLKVRSPELADKASLLLKVGFGIAVIVCSIAGYGYYLNHFLLLSFAPPFVWILLIGPSPRSGANSLSRTVIAFAAVLLTLQIFPIAGTQMAYGSFLIVIIGAACAYEGISDATSLTDWTSRRRVQLTASAIACIAIMAFSLHLVRENSVRYYSQEPLDLPGARLVRLPAADVGLYRDLVANLNAKCDSFITMPGLYSFYFWTGKDSPTRLNATAWMSLLNDAQQRRVVDEVRQIPRLCAIYHPKQTANGSRNRDLARLPLSAYIFENMQIDQTLGEYQFMIRK